jgi:hypothetical protein
VAGEYQKDKARVISILGGKCCGYGGEYCDITNPKMLQADHIDPDTNPVPSNGCGGYYNGLGWRAGGMNDAIYRIKKGEDITKIFQLLCANHHAVKTFDERTRIKSAYKADSDQLDMFPICS